MLRPNKMPMDTPMMPQSTAFSDSTYVEVTGQAARGLEIDDGDFDDENGCQGCADAAGGFCEVGQVLEKATP